MLEKVFPLVFFSKLFLNSVITGNQLFTSLLTASITPCIIFHSSLAAIQSCDPNKSGTTMSRKSNDICYVLVLSSASRMQLYYRLPGDCLHSWAKEPADLTEHSRKSTLAPFPFFLYIYLVLSGHILLQHQQWQLYWFLLFLRQVHLFLWSYIKELAQRLEDSSSLFKPHIISLVMKFLKSGMLWMSWCIT